MVVFIAFSRGNILRLSVHILQAMVATAVMHSAEEAATRIVPSAAPLTVDPVQEVRHTALAAVDVFAQILRDHNRTLDDSLTAAGEAIVCRVMLWCVACRDARHAC